METGMFHVPTVHLLVSEDGFQATYSWIRTRLYMPQVNAPNPDRINHTPIEYKRVPEPFSIDGITHKLSLNDFQVPVK